MRFPIVQSTENLDVNKFKDPEAALNSKILGTVSITDNELAAKITQEAKAGRSVYLQAKTVDRQDGTFVIAAVITSSPARPVASMPIPAIDQKLDESGKTTEAGSVSIAAGDQVPAPTADVFSKLSSIQGSGEGSGTGSGSGGGSGSGPDAV